MAIRGTALLSRLRRQSEWAAQLWRLAGVMVLLGLGAAAADGRRDGSLFTHDLRPTIEG